MMTLPHLHLILNHVPTVGTGIAIGLLLLSLVRKNHDLRRVSLELFYVVALVTLPAYLSGVGTMLRIQDRPDISRVLMDRHHDAALIASALMLLTGATAWVGLFAFRRRGRYSGANLGVLILLSTLTFVAMARTGTLGGEVRHPEMMWDEAAAAAAAAATPQPGWMTAASVQALVTEHEWTWPSLEALHFIGLGLMFGVLIVVNSRLLGAITSVPYSAVHRLLPWALLGLSINVVTGMCFVIGTPDQYASAPFYWKMTLLVLGGANLLYLTVFEGPWNVRERQAAPLRVKVMAAAAICLWIGVMYFGRMLPFTGEAF